MYATSQLSQTSLRSVVGQADLDEYGRISISAGADSAPVAVQLVLQRRAAAGRAAVDLMSVQLSEITLAQSRRFRATMGGQWYPRRPCAPIRPARGRRVAEHTEPATHSLLPEEKPLHAFICSSTPPTLLQHPVVGHAALGSRAVLSLDVCRATAAGRRISDAGHPGQSAAFHPPTLDRWPVAYYDFTGDGERVIDRSGLSPAVDLTIADPRQVRREGGSLEVLGSTAIRSGNEVRRINEAIRISGEVSVEAWIASTQLDQTGPARIVTLSRDPSERNLTLGQDGGRLEVRCRTSTTSSNGTPAVISPPDSLSTRIDPRGLHPGSFWHLANLFERPAGTATARSGRHVGMGGEFSPGAGQ